MSASGLPGRRVDAMRAGMMTMGFNGGLDAGGVFAIGVVQSRYAAQGAQTVCRWTVNSAMSHPPSARST